MAHQLERIMSRHKRMMGLHLKGMTNTDIAKETGQHINCVSQVLNSPIVQDEVARLRGLQDKALAEQDAVVTTQARSRLETLSVSAATTLGDLLEDEDPHVKLKSANSILDKALGKSDVPQGANIHINAEHLNLLNLAATEAASIPE